MLQICIGIICLVSATPPTVLGQSFWNFTGTLQLSFDFTWEICHLLDITAVAGHLAWLAVLFDFRIVVANWEITTNFDEFLANTLMTISVFPNIVYESRLRWQNKYNKNVDWVSVMTNQHCHSWPDCHMDRMNRGPSSMWKENWCMMIFITAKYQQHLDLRLAIDPLPPRMNFVHYDFLKLQYISHKMRHVSPLRVEALYCNNITYVTL